MKYPVVLRFRHFPPLPYAGISLFGVLIFRKDCIVTPQMIQHERIHFRQQLEWFFLLFFLLYFVEFLIHLVRYRSWQKAYYYISFEQEAYRHESETDYLKHRPLWANYRKRTFQ